MAMRNTHVLDGPEPIAMICSPTFTRHVCGGFALGIIHARRELACRDMRLREIGLLAIIRLGKPENIYGLGNAAHAVQTA